MSWNYRVMKREVKTPSGTEEFYAIYEVYYDKNNNVKMWSEDPVHIQGETLKELKQDLEYYAEALNKPVLNYNELEEKFNV